MYTAKVQDNLFTYVRVNNVWHENYLPDEVGSDRFDWAEIDSKRNSKTAVPLSAELLASFIASKLQDRIKPRDILPF